MSTITIFGKHAVLEAVKQKPETIKSLYITERYLKDLALVKHLKKLPVKVVEDESEFPKDMDRKVVHQGIVAIIETDKLLLTFKDFIESMEIDSSKALILLGEVNDPHNVGAIIRSAAAFGFAGVLIPKHRQAPVTGTVVKVSAGTAFKIPLVEAGNVNSALRQLKKEGFWIYGLDAEGDSSVYKEDFTKPTVIVVGNEGNGMRLKTGELCDSILNIPINPRAESLNASVSAAVAMAFWRSSKI